MTPRALKFALALSVAVNVLVICALVAAAFVIGTRWPQERHEGRRHGAMAIVQTLEPDQQAQVRERLRAAALEARPDFRAAREARREAIALAQAEPMDAAAVSAALARSREAEHRARARLEAGLVEALAGLDAQGRRQLAPVLARRGPEVRIRHHGGRPPAPGEAPQGPPPAP